MSIRLDNTNTGTLILRSPVSGTSTLLFPPNDGTPGQFLQTDGFGTLTWATVSGGSSAISSLTAATASNTINNSINLQTWNWALIGATQKGMIFSENVASTGGVNSQFLVELSTLASSTAGPFRVIARTNNIITVTSRGVISMKGANANNGGSHPASGVSIFGGDGDATNVGANVVLQGGANTTTTAGGLIIISAGQSLGNGGELSLSGGGSTGAGNGGNVNVSGGQSVTGAGGLVAITGGTLVTSGPAGGVNISGGSTPLGMGGTITITATNAAGAGNDNGGNVFISTGSGTGSGTAGSFKVTTNGAERLEILGAGGWEIGGSEGVTGQAIISNGSGTPPTWQSVALLADDNVFTAGQSITPVTQTVSGGGNFTPNPASSNNFRLRLDGSITLNNPSGNPADGQILNFYLKINAASPIITFGSKYKFTGGVAPTPSTTSGDRDFMSCYYDSADDVLVCNYNNDYS